MSLETIAGIAIPEGSTIPQDKFERMNLWYEQITALNKEKYQDLEKKIGVFRGKKNEMEILNTAFKKYDDDYHHLLIEGFLMRTTLYKEIVDESIQRIVSANRGMNEERITAYEATLRKMNGQLQLCNRHTQKVHELFKRVNG